MLKRIISPMVALIASAGLFLALSLLPEQVLVIGDSGSGLYRTLTVEAKALQLVCPGSGFVSGAASSAANNATSFKRLGTAIVDYSSDLPAGVGLTGRPLTGPAAANQTLADSALLVSNLNTISSFAVTVKDQSGSAQQGSSLFTAQSYEIASASGVVGALGANCQQPVQESWLVGGVTTIGRQSLLILANPSSTDATVDLQLFGSTGPLLGSGLTGISVSANRTVVLPLAGFAPDEDSITVHVISAGAPIASWLQESTVRGTVAAGAELIAPSVPAATQLVIPGLLKRGTADGAALIAANPNYADLTPSIHIFVPGKTAATVTVQVVGSNSKSTGTVRQETVAAGASTVLDIPGLGDGDYSVFVVSSQPVMAGLKFSRNKQGASPPTDFAWIPAVRPLSNLLAVATPKTAVSKLSIANVGAATATVTVVNRSDGTSQTVKVPRLSSAVVAVAAGAAVGVSSDIPVATTMVCDFNGQVVALPLLDPKNTGGKLAVRVR